MIIDQASYKSDPENARAHNVSIRQPAGGGEKGNVTTRENTSKFPTLHTLTMSDLQADSDAQTQSQSRLIRGGHRSWTDSIFGSERFPF